MKLTIDMPKIPEEQKSELVVLLLEVIRQQGEIIQELKDEIARLKGHNPKPKRTPGQLEQPKNNKSKGTIDVGRRHKMWDCANVRRVAPAFG
jgi:hypothetical protein